MIYLDYNAGAPRLLPEIARHLASVATAELGNPSSVHQAGRAARKRLDAARDRCARLLGCTAREIVFTGSGSEAAAIALRGAWAARADLSKRRVVTSAIEHPCVLGAMKQLERDGAQVVRVPPNTIGLVDAMVAALTPDTALCSLMAVNNETGVVQPAGELARECARRKIVFHCDAVQAAGRVPVSLREVPADLLSLSAHKLGGPAGVGLLSNRRGVDVAALTPGHQENGRRGGTQSVVMAEAMAMALEHAFDGLEANVARLTPMRDRFEAAVRVRVPGVAVNGAGAPRACNTSNLRFESLDGEALLIALDLEGLCVSSGAACASGSLEPSHVLVAMGLTSSQAQESLRFSLGEGTTEAELDTCVEALARLVPKVRAEAG